MTPTCPDCANHWCPTHHPLLPPYDGPDTTTAQALYLRMLARIAALPPLVNVHCSTCGAVCGFVPDGYVCRSCVEQQCSIPDCAEPYHGTCCLCDARTCFEHGTFSQLADEWFCHLSYDVRYGRTRAWCELAKSKDLR